MFRGAKAKGGFRERILASRKMNVMQKMKQAAAAFSKGSSSFSHSGFALLKLNPYLEIIKHLRKPWPSTLFAWNYSPTAKCKRIAKGMQAKDEMVPRSSDTVLGADSEANR